jgi:acetylornithine deacetylase/succinyl-diaminopimelate desuccinylase-like protein
MLLDAQTAASAHGDAERIPVSEFLTGLRVYYDVLSAL